MILHEEGIDLPDKMGNEGEKIAVSYLIENGYQILDKNWHFGHREIDIVAKKGDEIVVVEVKARRDTFFEEPSDAVGPAKIRNIVAVTNEWLIEHKIDLETRFDIISVLFTSYGSYSIEHMEGAFTAPVE